MCRITKISFIVVTIFLCACGVKAPPLPPTVAPAIGDGTPKYYKNNSTEKIINKYNENIENEPEDQKSDKTQEPEK